MRKYARRQVKLAFVNVPVSHSHIGWMVSLSQVSGRRAPKSVLHRGVRTYVRTLASPAVSVCACPRSARDDFDLGRPLGSSTTGKRSDGNDGALIDRSRAARTDIDVRTRTYTHAESLKKRVENFWWFCARVMWQPEWDVALQVKDEYARSEFIQTRDFRGRKRRRRVAGGLRAAGDKRRVARVRTAEKRREFWPVPGRLARPAICLAASGESEVHGHASFDLCLKATEASFHLLDAERDFLFSRHATRIGLSFLSFEEN